MRRGSSGVSWTFFLSVFFLFAGFSLENALNSKLCLHQGFWSLAILLAELAGTAYGEPFVTVPSNPFPEPAPALHGA